MPRCCSANSPNFELSRDVQLSVLRLVRVDRLQLLNSLLAVTETDSHLEDVRVVTHGSLQVRHDKLRTQAGNRMATLRGCVRRVAAQDTGRLGEGKPGQATIF